MPESSRMALTVLGVCVFALVLALAGLSHTPKALAAPLSWLHVDGNRIVDESGRAVVLRGANVDNMNWEWAYSQSVSYERRAIPKLTGKGPGGWRATLVALPFASGPVNSRDTAYLSALDEMVSLGKANGAYTLLSYRSWDPDTDQHPRMPDQAAQDALAALAARYAGEPAVLYALQMEPHDVTWGELKPRFTSMVDAIRAKNPRALIAVPGTQWSRYIHYALTNPVPRPNLIYKSNPWDYWEDIESDYQLPEVAERFPVLLGEFGAGSMMRLRDVRLLLDLAEEHGMSWAGWIFHTKMCPCMLTNAETFDVTPYGAEVKARLQAAAPIPTPSPTSTPAPTATPVPVAVTNLPIRAGDLWRYRKGTSEPSAGWKGLAFDDSAWFSGPSGFGYGDGDDATVLSDMSGRYTSTYIRKKFNVPDPASVASLTLTVDYDDGFVAYLNGVEVARANVSGTPPAYSGLALSNHEASRGDTSPQPAAVFDLTGYAGLLVRGVNVLVIQGHNRDLGSSDFSLIPSLTATFKSAGTPTPAPAPTSTSTPAPAQGSVHIREGEVWRYFKGTSGPPAAWNSLGLNDSGWSSGPSGLGYGDGDDATVLSDMSGGYVSLYIRKKFNVTNPAVLGSLTLKVDYDDGFVAYLNGVEVARANITGNPPAHTYRAPLEHEASRGDTSPEPAEVFDLTPYLRLLRAGDNVLAIQGHNKNITSSDFSLIPSLSSTVR